MGTFKHINLKIKDLPVLLTIQQAVKVTGIPKSTFYNWRDDPGNGLRFIQFAKGGALYIRTEELERWLNSHARIA